MGRSAPPTPSLAARRKAAAAVLRRRVRGLAAWQGTLALLLLLTLAWAALVAYGALDQPGDAWHRLSRLVSGQNKEAFLLGWLTYVGWRVYFLMAGARRRRRAARIALTLLRRGHPQWYQALT